MGVRIPVIPVEDLMWVEFTESEPRKNFPTGSRQSFEAVIKCKNPYGEKMEISIEATATWCYPIICYPKNPKGINYLIGVEIDDTYIPARIENVVPEFDKLMQFNNSLKTLVENFYAEKDAEYEALRNTN